MNNSPKSFHHQLGSSALSPKETYFVFGILGLLLFALFFKLGVHPLKHEEPRRALVALEMIFRNNWIVPTEVGEWYYNKPPVYNWLIILSFKIFGAYSELAVRFFSVLSFLGMALLIYLFGKCHVNQKFAIYASLFFLCSVDILYYFSLTGEIDLFYSLITLGCMLAVFHYHQQQKFWTLFVGVYVLTAIGTLTKGLPSIAFTGITLVCWFTYQKDFRKLFLPAHFVAIFIFLLIVAGYFWIYSHYNDPSGFLERLYSESSSRTAVDEGNGFLKLAGHFLEFPLTNLLNIMPASLLLVFMLRKNFMQQLKSKPVLVFLALTFVANFLLYCISPGARARYVYMLYPLPIMLMIYFFLFSKEQEREKKLKVLHHIIRVLIIIFAVAGMVLPFIPQLQESVPNLWLVGILASLGSLIILWLFSKFPDCRILSLLLLLIWVRVIFDLSIIPLRAKESSEAQDKRDAAKIVSISDKAPLHILEGSAISRTTVFYIERAREQVLDYEEEIQDGHYYMVTLQELAKSRYEYEALYNFQYQNDTLQLVKFK